jgi:hypothetical protein
MVIQLGVAVQNLDQVLALIDTPVDYIRLGYPYCQPLAEFLWPPEKVDAALEAIAEAGKIPQFQWLISPGPAAQGYLDNCLEIVGRFPQSEIVISHWGGVELALANIKLAAYDLAIYNSSLICLLRERGIRVIGLPLGLNSSQMLSAVISSSPVDTIFEYHLWGPVMSSHWWRCPATGGKCNPRVCIQPVKFNRRGMECGLRGRSLWLAAGVDNLSRTLELVELGIERGLIQLPDIPPQATAQAIDYCLARIDGN